MAARGRHPLLLAGAVLTLVVGAVHVQQYLDFIYDVPTIGWLFVLNGFGAGALAIGLMSPNVRLQTAAALGAIGLSVGALVSITISLTSTLFDYSEPDLRFPIVVAIVAEAGAVLALGGWLAGHRTADSSTS